MRIHRSFTLVLAALAVTLAPAKAGAQATPRVLQAGATASSVHLVDTGGLLVIGRGEESLEFELPAATRVDDVAPTTDGWVAAGRYSTGAGGELLILRQKGDEITLLPVPPGKEDRIRGTPAVLTTGRRLVGLAWLEGTRQDDLTVRAATWDGNGWSQPEMVSPRGPGAQLALRGTMLDDGSWLLVWAAVDGQDDDVWWSRRTESGWTAPSRVHADNAVPDIQPAVSAVPGGAVVAWSAFDGGHYRIRVARFDGSEWTEKTIESGRGAVQPTWQRHAGGWALLYSSVEPAAWSVVDFDGRARVKRRAAIPHPRPDRPLLEWTSEGRPRLRWPRPALPWPAESQEADWETKP